MFVLVIQTAKETRQLSLFCDFPRINSEPSKLSKSIFCCIRALFQLKKPVKHPFPNENKAPAS
jgi:hypothetical protein